MALCSHHLSLLHDHVLAVTDFHWASILIAVLGTSVAVITASELIVLASKRTIISIVWLILTYSIIERVVLGKLVTRAILSATRL